MKTTNYLIQTLPNSKICHIYTMEFTKVFEGTRKECEEWVKGVGGKIVQRV